MSTTVVIGGGVVGVTIAFRQAATGRRVVLLEAGRVGGGTSSATFSMHIATRKTPRAHFDLAVAGGRDHLRLAEGLGLTPGAAASWVHRAPAYEWPDNGHEDALIAARVERLREWGYPAEWVPAGRLRRWEPALRVPAAAERVAHYPDEYWYDSELMVATLAAAAAARGAELREGERVVAIESRPGRVRVRTATGAAYDADQVVIAAGPWTRRVAELAGHDVEVEEVPGLVVTTGPVARGTLNGIVLHPDVNLRPAPGGRLALQSYTVEATLAADDRGEVGSGSSRRILGFAAGLLPALADVPLHAARRGIRPVPADGLPIVGFLDGEARVYVAVAHSGVNLAPVLSTLVAAELRGEEVATLAPFRPGRPSLRRPDGRDLDESTREMHRMLCERSRPDDGRPAG
jgi:glycine/D-amino acid oxidase-like deaminating enzyme